MRETLLKQMKNNGAEEGICKATDERPENELNQQKQSVEM